MKKDKESTKLKAERDSLSIILEQAKREVYKKQINMVKKPCR